MSEFVVAALYKFVTLSDYRELKNSLLSFCKRQGVKGTLLLAQEGINGTISGSAKAIDGVLAYLKKDQRLSDIEYKLSYHADNPFYRMKVKLKKEIVTLGVDGIDPNRTVGQYVKPEDWNALISDPDVVLVDTRNDYEVAIGTFDGAIDPKTTTFREFPEFVEGHLNPEQHKKVAMFCTGGIRCEKSTAYMLEQGFEEVYHLQGGILKYLEEVPEEESLWHGECFVFDNRVAVDHQLQVGSYDMCHACRHPISAEDKTLPEFQQGVSCLHCYGITSDDDKQRFAQRQRQIELARVQQKPHIGITTEDIAQEKARKAQRAKQTSVS